MKTELGPALCCEGCQGCQGTVLAIRALEPTLARLDDCQRVDLANFMHDVAHSAVDVIDSVKDVFDSFSMVIMTAKKMRHVLRNAPVIVDGDASTTIN